MFVNALLSEYGGADILKNYRVGKMDSISVVGKDRLGHESFDAVRMDEHTEHIFGMFGGEKQKVTIEFPNNLAGVVIDRFGKDTAFIKTDADHFKIHVDVMVSPQFYGWVFDLGTAARIVGPKSVVQNMAQTIVLINVLYS